MTLIAYSLSHQTAPLALREQLVFSPEQTSLMLHQLLNQGAANEALMIFTCNRTELYAFSQDRQALQISLQKQIGTHIPINTENWRLYLDQDAVHHAMCVASGLEAMVLGESQILSQMKNAYALAQQQGTIGRQLHKLFQNVFSVAKQVRTQTGIGTSPVSVAYTAVKLAKRIFTNLHKSTVLLVGAGQNIELTAMNLINQGVKRIMVANRSFSHAQKLAVKFQACAIAMQDMAAYLPEVDIVICSTASPIPILGKGMIERALKIRKHRPMFMVDLAVPRDIEPEVATLEDVYLYNIDNLQTVIAESLHFRTQEAEEAKN